MKADTIHMNFSSDFKGEMISPNASTKIGNQENALQPYHMLFGALGSCFYATFLSIASKMKLTFSDATLDVSGYKRDEVPLTLETVEMNIVIYNGSDESKLIKAVELGAKYCSIHETISKVADIKLHVIFSKK